MAETSSLLASFFSTPSLADLNVSNTPSPKSADAGWLGTFLKFSSSSNCSICSQPDSPRRSTAVADTASRFAVGVKGRRDGIKLLGQGEIDRALTVKIHAVTQSARAKIEAAGGTVEVI